MTTEPTVAASDEGDFEKRLMSSWALRPQGAAVSQSRARALTAYGAAGRHAGKHWRSILAAAAIGLFLGGSAVAVTLPTALPGQPAYALKQFFEGVRVDSAGNADARTRAWFDVAESRLEESVRAESTGQIELLDPLLGAYVDAVEMARMYAAEASGPEATDDLEVGLRTHQGVLEGILATAPEPARAGLQRALDAAGGGSRGAPGGPPRQPGPPPGVGNPGP